MKKLIFCIFLFFPLICYSQNNSSTNKQVPYVYKTNVIASYYAEQFHGRLTSNGEVFDMNSLTAAHKTLPFNTILLVTNLTNKKSVQVRINDRGPFVKGREIDLSKEAARRLGMMKSGTAKVRLTVIKESPEQFWKFQFASYSSESNAIKKVKDLAKKGIKTNLEYSSDKKIIRVVKAHIPDSEKKSFINKLNTLGIKNYIVKQEK